MTPKDFVKKYGIGVSFEQMYALQDKMNRVNNFTLKDDVIKYSDKKRYVDGLTYMLSAYILKETMPKNIKAGVTLESFDFVGFIRDYEGAKKAEFKASGSTRERKAYEGVKPEVFEAVLKRMATFNISLADVWADRIRKGADLKEFRSYTIEATKEELIARGVSADDIANEPDVVNLNDPKSYALVRIAYSAMDKAIDKRTFLWRLNPFNWKRWYEENKYMSELISKIRAIEKSPEQLIESELFDQCKGKVINTGTLGKFNDICKSVKADADLQMDDPETYNNLNKEEGYLDIALGFDSLKDNERGMEVDPSLPDNLLFDENDLINADPTEHNLDDEPIDFFPEKKVLPDRLAFIKKPRELRDVRGLTRDRKVSDSVVEEITSILKKSKERLDDTKKTARVIYENLVMEISTLWQSPENMPAHVTNMFKNVYKMLGRDMPKMNVNDKLVAAQKISDVILNIYSPIASNPNLERYGDNYAIKNMYNDDIQKLTDYGENIEELVNDVKSELGIIEVVKFLVEEFGDDVFEKSEIIGENDPLVQSKVIDK